MSNSRTLPNQLELGQPLLPKEYRLSIRQKTYVNQEIQECIDILRRARKRKLQVACLFRASLLIGASYLLYWSVQVLQQMMAEYTVAATLEQETQRILRAPFAARFNHTSFETSRGFYPCTEIAPKIYPMMLNLGREDCCLRLDWGGYGPCFFPFQGGGPVSCAEVVDQYCKIIPSVEFPTPVLQSLGIIVSAMAIVGTIADSLYALFSASYQSLLAVVCSCPYFDCCVSDNNKIKNVAEKYGIKSPVGIYTLEDFEKLQQRLFARKTAFCLGSKEGSSLFGFFSDPLYDKNCAREILEFAGDLPPTKEKADTKTQTHN